MRHCDLSIARKLAASGAVEYRVDKSLLKVVAALDVDLSGAERRILAEIQSLQDQDYLKPGEGFPPPPCDVFEINREYWVNARWEKFTWYIKIGIKTGNTILWVESFHT